MKIIDEMVVFILTHGRPNNLKTLNLLKKNKYNGPLYLIIDSEDKSKDEYLSLYGESVIVFEKKIIAKKFDIADNFQDFKGVVYARNACFEISRNLGFRYFMQLDDDYISFDFRFDSNINYFGKKIKNINQIFNALLDFYKKTNIEAISILQNGDFIGGKFNDRYSKNVSLFRKAMNLFICSIDRPFNFLGRINEDVNTYVRLSSIGKIFFSTNQISLQQTTTQKNKGGLTEQYLEIGTYVKSFYTVIYQPSSAKVKLLNTTFTRLHHSIDWENTSPKIIREKFKK